MPKMKTHRGAAKRFKVTGTGKILRRKAFRAHLLEKKSSRRTRRLGRVAEVTGGDKQARRALAREGVATWHASSVPSTARSTAARSSKRRKGYTGARSRHFRKANEQVMHSLRYAYRDRRARKGEFRRLWIVRINAACREHDIAYSRFIAGLKAARGRRRPQDPRRPRGARAGDVRCARRDRTRGARRSLSPTLATATPTPRSRRLRRAAPRPRARATTHGRVRRRRSARRRGRARPRAPRSRRCTSAPTLAAVHGGRRARRGAGIAGRRARRRSRGRASATRVTPQPRVRASCAQPRAGIDAFGGVDLVVVGAPIARSRATSAR